METPQTQSYKYVLGFSSYRVFDVGLLFFFVNNDEIKFWPTTSFLWAFVDKFNISSKSGNSFGERILGIMFNISTKICKPCLGELHKPLQVFIIKFF
jgi:hypothetical protein